MRASHYFTAAAVTRFLGSITIGVGALSMMSRGTPDPVVGLYGALVVAVAIGAPILLLLAGIVSLSLGPPPGGNRS